MDRDQEEMQFLGPFGIYKEAYKLVISWKKIFSQITLALILPLCLIYLIQKELSNALCRGIFDDEIDLLKSRPGSPKHDKLSHAISSELAALWLFKAVYIALLVVFSLLSTSTVGYTIACIYAGKQVTFKEVLRVVPKVWKRLIVTFFWTFLTFSAYNVVAVIVLYVTVVTLFEVVEFSFRVDLVILTSLAVLYSLGFVWLCLVWQLACVVSVLEGVRGIGAMRKSNALLKGKIGLSFFLFSKFAISIFMVGFAFKWLFVNGWSLGLVEWISYAIICLLALLKLVLFGIVTQTVLYFVCKSYHHESIDKSALSDHLEVYQLDEYVPLKAKDLQLEQFHV